MGVTESEVVISRDTSAIEMSLNEAYEANNILTSTIKELADRLKPVLKASEPKEIPSDPLRMADASETRNRIDNLTDFFKGHRVAISNLIDRLEI